MPWRLGEVTGEVRRGHGASGVGDVLMMSGEAEPEGSYR